MVSDKIIIKGAREHNLKNINLELPKNKFIVITGISGSGKSTLAFDTLYAEGQRRYVESLSSYARQFLGPLSKPEVDFIEGLSPTIAIEQKSTSKNPRSTVGTTTEIYDYLRLLYARIGIPYCPTHKEPIISKTKQEIAEKVKKDFEKEDITILSPIVNQKKGTYEKLIFDLNKEGYSRVRVDGNIIRTDEKVDLSKYKKHDIEIVFDRLNTEEKTRLYDSIEKALDKSDGKVIIQNEKGKEKIYSQNLTCPKCDLVFEELQPRMFSFNSPFGACEDCLGLGVKIEFDSDLIIPDKTKSIIDGAIKCFPKIDSSWRQKQLAVIGKKFGFDLFTPIDKFTDVQFKVLLYGTKIPITGKWPGGAEMHMENGWEGLLHQQERLYKETTSEYRKKELEKFMRVSTCPSCHGKRLKEKILSVMINGKSIIDVADLPIAEAKDFFEKLILTEKETQIANQILEK